MVAAIATAKWIIVERRQSIVDSNNGNKPWQKKQQQLAVTKVTTIDGPQESSSTTSADKVATFLQSQSIASTGDKLPGQVSAKVTGCESNSKRKMILFSTFLLIASCGGHLSKVIRVSHCCFIWPMPVDCCFIFTLLLLLFPLVDCCCFCHMFLFCCPLIVATFVTVAFLIAPASWLLLLFVTGAVLFYCWLIVHVFDHCQLN